MRRIQATSSADARWRPNLSNTKPCLVSRVLRWQNYWPSSRLLKNTAISHCERSPKGASEAISILESVKKREIVPLSRIPQLGGILRSGTSAESASQ
jgi:hypothetical protein